MKRHKIPLVLLMVFLVGTTAQAQQSQPAPQQRGGATTGQAGNGGVLNLIGVIGALQQPGQRGGGGGGRGGAPANPPNQDNLNPNNLSVILEDGRLRRIQINPDPDGTGPLVANRILSVQGVGAWWTNTNLLTRLGLTDDQKLKIERVYESHRQNLVTTKDMLEKEEAQLARLLEADALDRTASVAQIYKVVQARGEMEKTNSLMTFEMREVLTRAQWTQLQAIQPLGLSPLIRIQTQDTPGGFGIRGGRGGIGPGTSPFGVLPPPAAGGPAAPAPGTGGQRSGARGQQQ